MERFYSAKFWVVVKKVKAMMICRRIVEKEIECHAFQSVTNGQFVLGQENIGLYIEKLKCAKTPVFLLESFL